MADALLPGSGALLCVVAEVPWGSGSECLPPPGFVGVVAEGVGEALFGVGVADGRDGRGAPVAEGLQPSATFR